LLPVTEFQPPCDVRSQLVDAGSPGLLAETRCHISDVSVLPPATDFSRGPGIGLDRHYRSRQRGGCEADQHYIEMPRPAMFGRIHIQFLAC
jgi:hypothetical protein